MAGAAAEAGKFMENKKILGVRVDNLSEEQAHAKAREFLTGSGQHKIFTPNPEMVVKAQKDEYFKKVLNSGDLNLCDGFGLSLFSGAPRITGVDFLLDICSLAEKESKSIYLLGSGSDEVVKKTAEELQEKFPCLQIAGLNPGPKITEIACHSDKMTDDNDEVLRDIQFKQPVILFVAFGMGKQEKWIQENLAKLPSVKIAMGVGGAFDYLAGAVPRAPRLMRAAGLEWLYRLIQQPSRIGRIFNATARFFYLVLTK